jgi:NAD(P)-dependent dehydrogenase (short-subunit alcohol dehydrogenase family)
MSERETPWYGPWSMTADGTYAERREALLSRLFDLRGRHVLVTGAASGLGRAIAEAMADAGADLTLVDTDVDALEVVAASLQGRRGPGGTVVPAVCDISDAAAVASTVQDAASRFSSLDVVFANAGIPGERRPDGPASVLEQVRHEDWDRVLAVNLNGVLHTIQAAASVMRPQGSGRIVVTASTAGLRADPMVGYGYIASKAAVVNMVRQAALDLAPHNVRVNAIAPGPFRTNIGGKGPPNPEAEARWATTIPLGRMGDPEEVQGMALLLASPASSFMTGGVFPVDGGALALSHAL